MSEQTSHEPSKKNFSELSDRQSVSQNESDLKSEKEMKNRQHNKQSNTLFVSWVGWVYYVFGEFESWVHVQCTTHQNKKANTKNTIYFACLFSSTNFNKRIAMMKVYYRIFFFW